MKSQSRKGKIWGSIIFVLLTLPVPLSAQDGQDGARSLHGQNGPERAMTGISKEEAAFQALTRQIAQSGRVLQIGASPADRLLARPHIPPGAAPVLRFRVLEEHARFRLGRLDLMVDDAGH